VSESTSQCDPPSTVSAGMSAIAAARRSQTCCEWPAATTTAMRRNGRDAFEGCSVRRPDQSHARDGREAAPCIRDFSVNAGYAFAATVFMRISDLLPAFPRRSCLIRPRRAANRAHLAHLVQTALQSPGSTATHPPATTPDTLRPTVATCKSSFCMAHFSIVMRSVQ
jgi:hypothetical protein